MRSRDAYAEASGEAVMELLELQLRPRDIVTRKALRERRARRRRHRRLDQCRRCTCRPWRMRRASSSTWTTWPRSSSSTPYIADLKPGGKYVAKDMCEVGGMPVLIKALLDGGLLHGDCMTVTGKTLAENHKDVVFPTDQDVIRPASKPLSPTGGVVGLKGILAPDGAIVKVAGMKTLQFRGPARVFDCEEDAFAAVENARLQGRRRHRHPLRRARRAARACARCCRPPRRSTARAWARRWR